MQFSADDHDDTFQWSCLRMSPGLEICHKIWGGTGCRLEGIVEWCETAGDPEGPSDGYALQDALLQGLQCVCVQR